MKILVAITKQQFNLHQVAPGKGFSREGGGGFTLCQSEGTHQIQEIVINFYYLL